MVRKEFNKTRRELLPNLEQKLLSVKDFEGCYEYERDYLKVYEKLKETNPFSVLVFYETPEIEISLAKRKKLNPNVPERMLAGIASYAQFYFTPELEERRIGAWIGSGYRSTQSTYALALAKLSKKIDVPTHILILNKQCIVKHVLSSKKLIVQPHEVIQNVSMKVANRVLKNTIKAYKVGDLDKIESIYIVRSSKK